MRSHRDTPCFCPARWPSSGFFTKDISSDGLLRIYSGLARERELPGKVAVKLHSGEPGGHHPHRVYDEETRAASGTNADVISDILLDLPIRRQREPIGPDWHRDEEILRFDPDLIVIHYSGFRQEDGSGPRERLKVLVAFFADSEPSS